MKKLRTILLLVLLLLLLFCGLLWFWLSAEPSYNGHPLSWWFDKVGPPPPALAHHEANDRYYFPQEVQAAFRFFGQKSVPFLLAKAQQKQPSPTKEKWIAWFASTTHIPIFQRSPELERRKAVYVLEKLGPQAKEAVPALTNLLRESRDPGLRIGILYALAAMAPDSHAALPVVLEAAADSHDGVRSTVALILPRLARNPEQILPCLERFLSDPSWTVCHAAAQSLIAMDRLPKRNVPALLAALARQDRYSQTALLGALYPVDPETTLQFFLTRCHDPDPRIRADAIHALGQLRDRPGLVLSSLIEALADKDDRVRSAARWYLSFFGQGNPQAIAALMKAAVTADDIKKAQILQTLKKIDPQSVDSFTPIRRW